MDTLSAGNAEFGRQEPLGSVKFCIEIMMWPIAESHNSGKTYAPDEISLRLT
jgi:hypothetical protein